MTIETSPILRKSRSGSKMASDIILRQRLGNTKGNKPSIMNTNAMAAIIVDSNIHP